ncbi:helix-turn-helix domain-containing protein [Limosilactobacillus kribbianus]|uniref:helix-turn-helix domain-containing protein n=1 Tax=Limosilactobacillus kribbianus TaxID=2982695 RepID=UPI0022644F7A|nr:helix-turn-helix domain-containing protein [Limosilactobacillus kribbianus]
MNNYFLRFFAYQQPRRIRVVENLLTSRRTVANLFWGQQYHLLPWLGAARGLTRADYDAALTALADAGLIKLDEQTAELTSAGVAAQEALLYQPTFLDWYWLANTNQLTQRFTLGMQVVAELAYHNSRYAPVNVSYRHLMAVKQWFRYEHARRDNLVKAVYDDLKQLGTGLASADPRLAAAMTLTMVGHHLPALTTDQLTTTLKLAPADTPVLIHDLHLGIAAYSSHTNGPLHDLLEPLLASGPLSRSAENTLRYYQSGQPLELIARRRHLKLSTIREHLLEVAILCPDRLNWNQLLPAEKEAALARQYPGDNVADWHFQADAQDEGAAFFEYRLFQIKRGWENNDQN